MRPMRELMEDCVNNAQKSISDALTEINGKSFKPHPWTSNTLEGGGIANIFSGGNFLEKGGVNVSTVRGKVFGEMAKMLSMEQQLDSEKYKYFATGISLVLHPYSPLVPTIHANYRYFEIEDEKGQLASWFFGGGTDLTPYYLFEEDAIMFHQTLKEACDETEIGLYAKLKKEADAYFYLPHRKEHRGVGGIFSLRMKDKPAEELFKWVQNCSQAIMKGYLPIVRKRMHQEYDEFQKKWQLIRRGRYVEFNLMQDVGTQFGLKSGGHVENILMSLPPNVSWEFNFQTTAGSAEEELLTVIKNPKEWV